jgi:hypothetical protein
MKHLFNLLFAMVVTISASAQFRDIPGAVTNAFKAKYPEATNVQWDDRVTNFQAKFIKDSATYEARFDKNGTWIETEKAITFDALPEAVKSAFRSSKFADYTIRTVAEIEKANGGKELRLYIRDNVVKRKYLYYSPDGTFLRDDTKI